MVLLGVSLGFVFMAFILSDGKFDNLMVIPIIVFPLVIAISIVIAIRKQTKEYENTIKKMDERRI